MNTRMRLKHWLAIALVLAALMIPVGAQLADQIIARASGEPVRVAVNRNSGGARVR